jgi:hypothetical protein
MLIAALVAACARAAAISAFRSRACSGHEQPISPMIPARTPVPSVPCSTASISSRSISAGVFAASIGPAKSTVYQPQPAITATPVRSLIVRRPNGSGAMPWTVSSTRAEPPAVRNRATSATAASIESRRLLPGWRDQWWRISNTFSSVISTSGSPRAASSGGVMSQSRCSCISVRPSASGAISPRTVRITPLVTRQYRP